MAIIPEHEEGNRPPKAPPTLRNRARKGKESDPNPDPDPNSSSTTSQNSNPRNQSRRPTSNQNPLAFWFYFTITVSLITLLLVFLSSFPKEDQKSWFLSLPASLRDHYSKGRVIKVQINPNEDPVGVFTYSGGPRDGEIVLIVHGLGCSSFTFRKVVDYLASKGVFAVAIDLPGSGFSDKGVMVESERSSSVFSRLWDLYDEIKEKGLFWGFDNLIENGYIPYEEPENVPPPTRKRLEPLKLGSKEVGRVLDQVIDAIGLAPLHLMLHDSALVMGANWVSANTGLLKSITLIDTMRNGTAFPLWVLDVPIVAEVVLGFEFVFRKVVDLCCSKSMGDSSVEAHRALLKGGNVKEMIVEMGKNLNRSFDPEVWANDVSLKSLPVQVVWSRGLSREWQEEGSNLADAIPKARFETYSGSRWPEEESASDLAGKVLSFLSSLPKTIKKVHQDPAPNHTQKMFDVAESDDQHRNLHHGDGRGHLNLDEQMHYEQMDGYGLGHGWNG